jgi:hypothetical protein
MNKFEALKQFESWPPEWQRLCAEYWAETDEGSDMRLAADRETLRKVEAVWCHADQIEATKKLLEPVATLAHESVSARLAQPKAAKVAAKPARNFMRYTREEISEVDAHLSEGRGPTEISVMMVRKHPNKRTREAWRKMAQWVRKHGFLVSMNQAVEGEFK